ncbi:MAG: YibE/F family protein [Clostridia bacterium]|nr:YibE/F family protein [Clostridia bacterium]
MKRRLGLKRSNAVMCVVMILFCAALCLLPERYENASTQIPRGRVRIEEVDNAGLYPVGIVYSGVQNCRVTVLSGEHQGEKAWASNYLNSALDKDKLYAVGDIAHAMVQESGGRLTVTLIDHDRTRTETAIALALAALLILYGGIIGCGALISLAASAMIVWKLLLPLLLEGVNPILAAFATVAVLTVMIDLLVAGWTRKTLIAVLGSLAGTAVTGVLSVALTDALKLDGGDIAYVVPLLSQSFMQIDIKSLYCGMIFIANSGALMDLSMDIAASCQEIVRHRPDVPRRELLASGMRLGRSVLGTMTTTLMLAYSGNYLSMLMYFMGQGTPLIDIVNLKYVASPLLNTLVGSFGLVAAAPLTALIASALYARAGTKGTAQG